MSYLLDTHILIWWLGADRRLSKQQRKALATASPGDPLVVLLGDARDRSSQCSPVRPQAVASVIEALDGRCSFRQRKLGEPTRCRPWLSFASHCHNQG